MIIIDHLFNLSRKLNLSKEISSLIHSKEPYSPSPICAPSVPEAILCEIRLEVFGIYKWKFAGSWDPPFPPRNWLVLREILYSGHYCVLNYFSSSDSVDGGCCWSSPTPLLVVVVVVVVVTVSGREPCHPGSTPTLYHPRISPIPSSVTGLCKTTEQTFCLTSTNSFL